MSTYQIKTATITFNVNAADSDMACMAANEEIQRRGLPIPSQRAELYLVGDGEPYLLGQFDLEGIELPTTWFEISKLKSDTFHRARQDARDCCTLPCIRSRGALLVVEDGNGSTLIPSGECLELPSSFRAFKATLARIKQDYQDAKYVWICIGCDAASNVAEFEHGDYTPWAGEAMAVVHEYQD